MTRPFDRLLGATCASLALVLGACPTPPPAHPETDAERLLGLVSAARARARSMRALARFDRFGAGGRLRGKIYVFVERPARMRFDTMTPFDNPLSILIVDGANFALWDVASRQRLQGPAASCVLSKALHLPLSPEQAVTALLGGPPVIAHRGHRIRWDDGHYRVELDGDDGRKRQVLKIVPAGRGYDVIESEISQGGTIELRIQFDRYEDVAGVRFPRRVRIEAPPQNEDVSVRYDEVELNAALPADAWTIDAPGVPVRTVGCDDIRGD